MGGLVNYNNGVRETFEKIYQWETHVVQFSMKLANLKSKADIQKSRFAHLCVCCIF